MTDFPSDTPQDPNHEPVFNLPQIIVVFAVILIGIHLARIWLASETGELEIILNFSFIPAHYGPISNQIPSFDGAWIWSPITYSFLHGDWMHLAMNLFWMLAFGTPLARRIGNWRFILLSVFASLGGALAHFIAHYQELLPVVGASGVVSAYMGAACRFVFTQSHMSMGQGFRHDGPSLSLINSLANKRALAFIGVWMAMNILFGVGTFALPGQGGQIAWEAHIGGFLVGLLGFFLFEPKQYQQLT